MARELRTETLFANATDFELRTDDTSPIDHIENPVNYAVGLNLIRLATLAGGALGETDGSERRHNVDTCRHAAVVRAVFCSLNDVTPHDVTLVCRDRRELRRNRNRIATDIYVRV